MAYLANTAKAGNENSLPTQISILLHRNMLQEACSNPFYCNATILTPRPAGSGPFLIREDWLTRGRGQPLVKRQLGICRIMCRKTFRSNRPLPAAEL